MKQKYDLIVVIPVGPSSKLEYIADTVNSILFYISGKLKIIIIDNSQRNVTGDIKLTYPEVEIITTQKDHGKMGGLYINLANAFRYALEQYDFELLLRIDDDALVIGKDPHLDAMRIIEADPGIGMLGRYIKGRISPDMYGNMHDNVYPRNTLLVGTSSWKFIRRPLVNWKLRELLIKGLANGYELGENIQGGAYFISRLCIQKMLDAGALPVRRLKKSILCEDHIFSLLTKMVGMKLADLSGAGEPFGVAWQGLPASPERLYNDNKKIIHSVRYWKEMKEDDIRGYFSQCRLAEAAGSTVAEVY